MDDPKAHYGARVARCFGYVGYALEQWFSTLKEWRPTKDKYV